MTIDIRRDERVTAVLLALTVFVLLTSYYILKVVREPLILLGGGAELKAYASAGQALLLLAVVPAFGWLASRVDRMRLLATVQAGFIACLIAFYLLGRAHAPIGVAFFLWLGMFNVFIVANFWSFANDLYTPEQGKRLFPIIALGGSIGAVLGALVPRPLHRLVGTYDLMLVAAGALAVTIALYVVIDRRERRRPGDAPVILRPAVAVERERPQPIGRVGGFALVMRDRYLRSMALLLTVATLVNTTGEYVIGKLATMGSAELAIADRGAFIAEFYSGYYGFVNIASLVLQAFVVSRVMQRLGIRAGLFVLPVVALVGWAGFLVFASLAAIRVAKVAENSLDYSLENTLRHALYLPTSRESKYKAKAAIDTFVYRVADAVAGLGIVFVLVSVLGLGVRAFAVVNLGLIAVWLVLAARTGALHDQRTAERAERAARGVRETAT